MHVSLRGAVRKKGRIRRLKLTSRGRAKHSRREKGGRKIISNKLKSKNVNNGVGHREKFVNYHCMSTAKSACPQMSGQGTSQHIANLSRQVRSKI